MLPADLAQTWLKLAEQQDRLGATEQACTLRYCAEKLTEALDAEDNTLLDLQQAAAESGYSADHLGRLVREGKIPNAGRPGAPRIARRDLPSKPKSSPLPIAEDAARGDTSFEQVVQSIIDEGVA